jgi:hypothetical protein
MEGALLIRYAAKILMKLQFHKTGTYQRDSSGTEGICEVGDSFDVRWDEFTVVQYSPGISGVGRFL